MLCNSVQLPGSKVDTIALPYKTGHNHAGLSYKIDLSQLYTTSLKRPLWQSQNASTSPARKSSSQPANTILTDGASGPLGLRLPIRITDSAGEDKRSKHFPPPLSNTFQSGRLAGVLTGLAHRATGQYYSFFTHALGHKPAIRIKKSKRPRGGGRRSLQAFRIRSG